MLGLDQVSRLVYQSQLIVVNIGRSELLLTLLSSKDTPADSPLSLVLKASDTSAAASTDAFLASHLRYVKDKHGQEICLLQLEGGEEVGVMMGWERDISTLLLLSTVTRRSSEIVPSARNR